jgi:redox-sensitive bicupin YhaK (pirin superfamily)
MKRTLTRIHTAVATSDGAGVKLRRALGHGLLPDVDPFLMLDEMHSDTPGDYIAGFPPHPHRGFETVSYMLQGAMEHKDSTGGNGEVKTGGVQWMTAGSGVIHSEMPKQEDGLLWGFQLWINLPAKDKMQPAKYRTIESGDIPEHQFENGVLRVIAGSYHGKKGPIKDIVTEPLFYDLRLKQESDVVIPVAEGLRSFIYAYEGSLMIDGDTLAEKEIGVLTEGDSIHIEKAKGGFLILAGRPIGEPVARHGPFVMTTKEEILKAFQDFREGKLVG